MGKLVAAARSALQLREAACREMREREALAQSARQLRNWESELCKRYPQALLDVFDNPQSVKKSGTLNSSDVGFDQLELMDEVQVLTSVALARTQQVAMLAAEVSLAELNTLICSTLGLSAVHAERNPLRPQLYIHALKAVIEQTQLPSATQLDWLTAMGATLGQELRSLYLQLCSTLRSQGVAEAGYVVVQAHSAMGVGRGVAQDVYAAQPTSPGPVHMPALERAGMRTSAPVAAMAPQARGGSGAAPTASPTPIADDTLLTLDKLRRLLSGELDVPAQLTPMEEFAQRFAREFEDGDSVGDTPATDFDATVPAALEALKEMEQVDEVVQRLQQRRGEAPASSRPGDTAIEAFRASMRSHSHGLGQALSLEVVTLMVDNIAQDSRLLEPVQQLIRRLEPALLQLSLVDPRLFTNKQHPARVLVQEIADHSLAYASVRSEGFVEFVAAIEQAFGLFGQTPVENSEPFERVLAALRDEWHRARRASARSRAQAMQALQHAEKRNLLAEKIAREIASRRDAALVPLPIMNFLCGPWAQVVAQARLGGLATGPAAEKYHALVSALLWSADPGISRSDTAKLTRLVPPLLATLREGLETIHYPSVKTSVFFEALMGLHQRAFRAGHKAAEPFESTQTARSDGPRPDLVEDGNPWVGPEEARASNFMDLPDGAPDAPDASAPTEALEHHPVGPVPETGAADAGDSEAQLVLGCWVELLVKGNWVRTQLTWTSPHGTLFLFTSGAGATQSMTRRSRDKLLAAGQLRVISGQPVVDGALNAVAQLAMRNSLNSTF